MAPLRACVVLSLVLAACVTWCHGGMLPTKDIRTMFENYDTNYPPKLDGPTDIRLGIYMNNILLDYKTGIMRINMYMRMEWVDKRLELLFANADKSVKTVKFDDEAVKATWRPDLFVRNADGAERVDTLVTEHLFRVNRTGGVWYVVRTINNLYCPQLFAGYHRIICPMMIESFTNTKDTLTMSYQERPFNVDPGLHLQSHMLEDLVLADCSQNYTAGSFPCLEMSIAMTRDAYQTTFECGIYFVTACLVIISWLGFWIPPSDKRIFFGLLVTLVLAVLYLTVAEWGEFTFADRTTHAQIWIIICLGLVLGMVFEFAVVYILFGTLRARVGAMCRSAGIPEDMEAKRSRTGDIVDTVFGLIVFPCIFLIALIAFGTSPLAFK